LRTNKGCGKNKLPSSDIFPGNRISGSNVILGLPIFFHKTGIVEQRLGFFFIAYALIVSIAYPVFGIYAGTVLAFVGATAYLLLLRLIVMTWKNRKT